MKSLTTLTTLALLLAASGALCAQQARGDMEVGFQGMYASISTKTSDSDDTTTTSVGMLQGTFGVFVTNHLELGIAPMITIGPDPEANMDTTSTTTTDTSSSTKTTTGLNVFGTWSFLANGARVSPYAGLSLYKQDLSDSDEKVSFGVTGGCKFYVAPKAAINVGMNLMVGKRSMDTPVITGSGADMTVVMEKKDMTTTTLMFQVGFSYLF